MRTAVHPQDEHAADEARQVLHLRACVPARCEVIREAVEPRNDGETDSAAGRDQLRPARSLVEDSAGGEGGGGFLCAG